MHLSSFSFGSKNFSSTPTFCGLLSKGIDSERGEAKFDPRLLFDYGFECLKFSSTILTCDLMFLGDMNEDSVAISNDLPEPFDRTRDDDASWLLSPTNMFFKWNSGG